MRELIQFGIGKCGCNISESFWSLIAKQHNIDTCGQLGVTSNQVQQYRDIYFKELPNQKFIPRSFFIQSNKSNSIFKNTQKIRSLIKIFPTKISFLQCLNFRQLGYWIQLNRQNLCNINHQDHFSKDIEEEVRKEVELCDYFSGFQFVFSLAGGTGSGLGSRILSDLREVYPDRIFQSFAIFPNFEVQFYQFFDQVDHNIYYPLNTILSINYLLENCDMVNCIDNQSLFNFLNDDLNSQIHDFNATNKYVAQLMSHSTASIRFDSIISVDLKKQASNLIPFPRLHFFINTFTPNSKINQFNNEDQINLSFTNTLVPVDLQNKNKIFSAYLSFVSDNFGPGDIDKELTNYQSSHQDLFSSWNRNILTSLCNNTTNEQLEIAGTLNCSKISEYFHKYLDQFDQMNNNQKFMKQFSQQGLKILYFLFELGQLEDYLLSEVRENINDLIAEYEQYFNCEEYEEENQEEIN